MNINYVTESLDYLTNTTEYLKSMVDSIGYDTCHHIKEYDARKCEKDCKKLGKSKPGGYKSLVSRHLGASAAEKIDKSDGAKLVAKGKKTGNTELIRKGNFIKNVISKK